jgi:tight adherence protein C
VSAATGALLGLLAGAGLLLVLARLPHLGPVRLTERVEAQLGSRGRRQDDISQAGVTSTVEGLARPYLVRAARQLERWLGGGASVQRRLLRAGSDLDLQGFRVEQVLWGAAAFGAAALASVVLLAGGSARSPGLLVVFCAGAAVGGVVLRDQQLSRQVSAREERILAELPTVADLLAVAVAAGESPSAALERVARVSRGDLGRELGLVLAHVRSGAGLVTALDGMATRIAVPAVTRFVDGIAVAVERGTPLADVLRAQAADAREVRKRTLMEIGGRKEILMLIPVVFLVLPVTVVFALYPGVAQFSVIAP